MYILAMKRKTRQNNLCAISLAVPKENFPEFEYFPTRKYWIGDNSKYLVAKKC